MAHQVASPGWPGLRHAVPIYHALGSGAGASPARSRALSPTSLSHPTEQRRSHPRSALRAGRSRSERGRALPRAHAGRRRHTTRPVLQGGAAQCKRWLLRTPSALPVEGAPRAAARGGAGMRLGNSSRAEGCWARCCWWRVGPGPRPAERAASPAGAGASGSASSVAADPLAPLPPLPQKLTVSYVSVTANYAPLYVAADAGVFARQGLDVDVTLIASGPTSIQSLVGGDVQFVVGASPAPVGAYANGARCRFSWAGCRGWTCYSWPIRPSPVPSSYAARPSGSHGWAAYHTSPPGWR